MTEAANSTSSPPKPSTLVSCEQELAVNTATKLARTFSAQLDALLQMDYLDFKALLEELGITDKNFIGPFAQPLEFAQTPLLSSVCSAT